MMRVSIKVEGLQALDRKLSTISEDLRGKALYNALNFASNPMLKMAKQKAAQAKEPHEMQIGKKTVTVQPGLLKSSIKRRRLNKKERVAGQYSAAIGIGISKKNKQNIYPRYWHFIENGTRKMPATPFIRPAFDANKDVFLERFKSQLNKAIDKHTNKT